MRNILFSVIFIVFLVVHSIAVPISSVTPYSNDNYTITLEMWCSVIISVVTPEYRDFLLDTTHYHRGTFIATDIFDDSMYYVIFAYDVGTPLVLAYEPTCRQALYDCCRCNCTSQYPLPTDIDTTDIDTTDIDTTDIDTTDIDTYIDNTYYPGNFSTHHVVTLEPIPSAHSKLPTEAVPEPPTQILFGITILLILLSRRLCSRGTDR